LEDLHVGAHHHPIVGRVPTSWTTVVLRQSVFDVGLARHDVAQVGHRELRAHGWDRQIAEIALSFEDRTLEGADFRLEQSGGRRQCLEESYLPRVTDGVVLELRLDLRL